MKKRVTEAKSSLAELLTIKLRKLITDEDFLSKKSELEIEIERLENQLKKLKKQPDYASKKSIEAFEFAATVKTKFKNGSKQECRSILMQVGSNLTLRDKKLLIQAKEPFNHFQNFHLAQKSEMPGFEPSKLRYIKHKNQLDKAGFCAIRALVENVRTFYIKNTWLSTK